MALGFGPGGARPEHSSSSEWLSSQPRSRGKDYGPSPELLEDYRVFGLLAGSNSTGPATIRVVLLVHILGMKPDSRWLETTLAIAEGRAPSALTLI